MTAKEQLEAMINGTHENDETLGVDEGVDEETTTEEEEFEETAEETEVVETEETEDSEDTDQTEDTEEEEDTETEIDESAEVTSESEEETAEEDAHDEPEDSEAVSKTEDTEDKVEDEADEAKTTTEDEVDYKAFYEKVALAKFTANGREVEGFKNPEDLIRAQQMLHGYGDKMKVLKEYKKFIKPLETRGVTADPDKFNLAMSLMDGDPEAIKKVLKEKGIDPMEMDLEDIKYVPTNSLPSDVQMLFEETYERADSLGVGDKFNRVVTKEWDDVSLQELTKNGAVRNDLLNHLADGTYDKVQNEIRRMELLDTTGALDSVPVVEKYRVAVGRLQAQQQPVVKEIPKVDTAKIEAEKAKLEKAKSEEIFKAKALEKEKLIAEQRKKAASVSKKKTVKKKTEPVKPEALKGDDFRDYFKNMMMN